MHVNYKARCYPSPTQLGLPQRLKQPVVKQVYRAKAELKHMTKQEQQLEKERLIDFALSDKKINRNNNGLLALIIACDP